ncbi:MAG: rubredoxin [Clostridia bacterium]
MKKYVCSICKYVYDEQKEGVKFKDLPDSWVCPLCGAPKSAFNEIIEPNNTNKNTVNIKKKDKVDKVITQDKTEANKELTNAELNVLCTNLAKGCEKQYKIEEMNLFNEIANYYKQNSEKVKESSIEDVSNRLNTDLQKYFPSAFDIARADEDRGALRILTWSEKVSKIVDILINRYKKEGVTFLKNTKIFVCEICGFIYIGDEAPEICPICKVPRFKIHEVGRV